jgi:hypothetical protein
MCIFVNETIWWRRKRRSKERHTAKDKEPGNIIKCCIFIAHSKGEYINGNDEETTTTTTTMS